jgi:hypothetical protein
MSTIEAPRAEYVNDRMRVCWGRGDPKLLAAERVVRTSYACAKGLVDELQARARDPAGSARSSAAPRCNGTLPTIASRVNQHGEFGRRAGFLEQRGDVERPSATDDPLPLDTVAFFPQALNTLNEDIRSACGSYLDVSWDEPRLIAELKKDSWPERRWAAHLPRAETGRAAQRRCLVR